MKREAKLTGARIIVLPHGRDASREFNISRRLIISILVLFLLLSLLIAAIVLTYGGLVVQARRVNALQTSLVDAQSRLVRMREINAELEEMRGIQEQVLVMLGAQDGRTPADHMDDAIPEAPAPEATTSADAPPAETLMTPPPDRWPVAGYVTREYSAGNISAGDRPHLGIDIVAPVGTAITAAGPGVVRQAGWDEFLGNFVEINHGFGYVTTYGHCAGVDVARGDRVAAGARIASMGGTGQVTAPHLHFEIWRDGRAINPRLLISGEPDDKD